MKKEQIHQIHLMRAECRTSSELTVPGCTEYTVTPEPDAREPWRKRKTGLDAAEWPKRAGDMSEHLPAVDCSPDAVTSTPRGNVHLHFTDYDSGSAWLFTVRKQQSRDPLRST